MIGVLRGGERRVGGYGVLDDVTSPTFALVHVYRADKSDVHHVDLYRLGGPRDLQTRREVEHTVDTLLAQR